MIQNFPQMYMLFITRKQRAYDAVRAYTMVDIFDEFYDKIRGKGEVKSITSNFPLTICMAKSKPMRKTKTDYIDDLNIIVFEINKSLQLNNLNNLLLNMHNAELVWVTPDAEQLIGKIARVSNPSNEDNRVEKLITRPH